jgi:phosphoglycerate dehydrogenase-like enzyme
VRILVALYSGVQAWRIPDAYVEDLRRTFPEHTFIRCDSDADTLAAAPDADVAFSSLITPAHLAAAPRLRWIHSPAVGVGSMLFPEMVRSQVVMTNARGRSSTTIAEHVIAVSLALMRSLPLAWRRQREKIWAQDELNAASSIRTLRGSRILIVGFGSIGAETARLAVPFGAEVVGVKRRAGGETPAGVRAVVPPSQLHDELPLADVVVIAAPQTAETSHLIGQRELELMKTGSILVNVSRGKLVDEAALVRALETGRLCGAALDVFDQEPLAAGSPLWERPDVLITPHVSGFHADYWPQTIRFFADNLRRFVAGQPLMNVVDKEGGY